MNMTLCCHSPYYWVNCICKQGTQYYRVLIQKHLEKDVSCIVQMWMFLYICIWLPLCHWVWSQAPWEDNLKESCWCTSMPTADDVSLTTIWLWSHISPFIWDGDCWRPAMLSPPASGRGWIWYHHQPFVIVYRMQDHYPQCHCCWPPDLLALAQMIIDGWQGHIGNVPCTLLKYHSSASILTVWSHLVWGSPVDTTIWIWWHNMKAIEIMSRKCWIPRMW